MDSFIDKPYIIRTSTIIDIIKAEYSTTEIGVGLK